MASDHPKLKLLCSFGGKILPRPSDGVLRYAGGQTRIVSLRRSATFADLLSKISSLPASPITAVKYQLPDEDLDALISVSSQEDLDNMMEEFDRISETSADGSARMRIFLFSSADLVDTSEGMDTGQSYINAVNGIGFKRKDSLVSASSSEGMLSPTHGSFNNQDSSLKLGFFGEETLVLGRVEMQQVQYCNQIGNIVGVTAAQPYAHPIYVNAAAMAPGGDNLKPIQGKMEPLGVAEDNLKPNVEENLYRSDQNSSNAVSNNGGNHNSNNNKGFHHQPLSQLPPLHPTHLQQYPDMYVPPLRPYPHLRFEDCQMCQKYLPHAHSDTLINEHVNGNGNGSESSGIHETRLFLPSHHSEGPARLRDLLGPENTAEPKVEATSGQFSHQPENDRAVHQQPDALDHVKLHHQVGQTVADPRMMQAAPRVAGSAADSEAKANMLATEKEKLVHENVEAFNPTKAPHSQNAVSGTSAESVVEQKVDNMVASTQYGAYGFAQIPAIQQKHDNEKQLVSPNAPTVVGLPSVTQASYAVVSSASQSQFPDPFLTLSQMAAPLHHLGKHDVVTKQNGNVVKNGNFHAAETPNRVPMPEISFDYVRPINGTMESLRVSAFEPSGITEQHRAAAAVGNRGVPMLKPDNSTLMVEHNYVVRPHVGGNAVFLDNSYIMAGIVPEGNIARPMNHLPPSSADLKPEYYPVAADHTQIYKSQAGSHQVYPGNAFVMTGSVPEGNSNRTTNQMPPSSLGFNHLKSMRPSETSQTSTMMTNHGQVFSYYPEMRVRSEVPNEQLVAVPVYPSGVTPAYNNNATINVVPKVALNNIADPLNGTATFQYSNPGGSNGHAEQFQGPSPLDSVFNHQDPQNLGNIQIQPPKINKVPSKEFIAPKDMCAENHPVNKKASDVVVLADEGGFHHLQNPANKDLAAEPARAMKG